MKGKKALHTPLFSVILAICLLWPAILTGGEEEKTPACTYPVGETAFIEELTYQVNWGFVPAGKAFLRLTPLFKENVLAGYKIESGARSNRVIDVFFPVRDETLSLVDSRFQHSTYFHKSQREGPFNREEVIEYDLLEGIAILFRNGRFKNSIRLPEKVHDPLSGLYRFRMMDARPGDTARIYATDGRRVILAKAPVLHQERIETPAGTFDCLKVELLPETLEGPFKRKKHGRIFIWFTDDQCRIPVKMSTEIIIGSVETLLEKVDYLNVPDGKEVGIPSDTRG